MERASLVAYKYLMCENKSRHTASSGTLLFFSCHKYLGV